MPFLSILLLLLPAWKINAQDRDVILVLDESGSMSGNKWESVKYAIQLAAALLDESDRLFVMRQDQAVLHPISLTAKQPSIDNIKKFGRLTETNHPEVIQRAVAQMKNDPGRKKVILFYGDGDWGYVQAACNQLIGAYSRVKPELYFLKVEDDVATLNMQSDFETAMSSISLFDVIRTNPNNGNELNANLQDISKKIAGADQASVDFKLSGSSLSFDVRFPLKKLLIIYQQESTSPFADPEITSVKGDQALEVSQKLDMESKILEGKYFEVKDRGNALIQKGQTILVSLDQAIDKERVLVIPVVAANLKTEFNSDIVSSDPARNEYVVCDDVQSIELRSFLEDNDGSKIASMDGVVVTANNGSRTSTFSIRGDHAVGKIDLQGDTTYISVEARYQGYFHQKDLIFTVTRKNCAPAVDTVAVDLGEVPFREFIRNPRCIGIQYFIDEQLVAPANYSLRVQDLPFGISCTIDSSGNSFLVCFKKTALFCDCMVPSGLIEGNFKAIPKIDGVEVTVKRWKLRITEEENFLLRNKQCIILAVSLILLLTYLYGVIKKPRFHRSARFDVMEVDKTAIYAPPNKRPRKKLVTGFVTRYLIPFKPENRLVDGMKIIASPSKSAILIAQESLSEKMSKNGEPVNPKSKKDLRVFRNNTVEIEKTATISTVYTYRVN